jgi:hypothetical protein
MSIRLRELVEKIPSDTKKEVDRARKRAGSALRDAIRQETGLLLNRRSVGYRRLNQREGQVSVPVTLEPGLPVSLRFLEFEDDFRIIAVLSQYRSALNNFADSSKKIEKLFAELSLFEQGNKMLQRRHEHLVLRPKSSDHIIGNITSIRNHCNEPINHDI